MIATGVVTGPVVVGEKVVAVATTEMVLEEEVIEMEALVAVEAAGGRLREVVKQTAHLPGPGDHLARTLVLAIEGLVEIEDSVEIEVLIVIDLPENLMREVLP